MDKKDFSILLVSTIVAAFFGTFIASFIVFGGIRPHKSEMHPFMGERPPAPQEFEKMMEHQEKIFEKDMRFFDRFDSDMEDLIERSPNMAGFIQMNNSGLQVEENPKEYQITLDLKPFNSDPANVSVKLQRNTLKISAAYESKDKVNFKSSQFFQSITLPYSIDKNSLKEEVKGEKLVITLSKK